MSTFIKVTQEGSRLLQLNAQQTQAARLAKLEGDEQRRTERQAREARRAALLQQGLDASGNAFGDLRRRRFRLDEPAATAISIKGGVVTCGFSFVNGVGDRNSMVAFSGDFNSYDYVDVSGSDEIDCLSFTLPVDDKACIVVGYGARKNFISDSSSVLETVSVFDAAWVCTASTVRRISVPAGISACLNILNPIGDDYEFVNEFNGVGLSGFSPRRFNDSQVGWAGDADLSFQFYEAWTPTVFELLNKLSPFTQTQNIKQFPSAKRPLAEGDRNGLVTNDDLGQAIYISEWLGEGNIPGSADYDRPDLLRLVPSLRIQLPPNWEGLADVPPLDTSFVKEKNLDLVWNWDDSNYCKRMCLALGFSPTDLIP